MKRHSDADAFAVVKKAKVDHHATASGGSKVTEPHNTQEETTTRALPSSKNDAAGPLGTLESLLEEFATQPERVTVVLGKTALEHMRSLLALLRGRHKSLAQPLSLSSTPDSRATIENNASHVSESITTPLPAPSEVLRDPLQLPEFPDISDGPRREAAYTHASYNYRQRRGSRQQDYQRLEWLGDRRLEFLAGEIVLERFPNWPPGKLSNVKSLVVNNATLNEISRAYKLQDRLKYDKNDALLAELHADTNGQAPKRAVAAGNKGANKVMADVLEAHIGAHYLEKGAAGHDEMRDWLKQVLEPVFQEHEREDAAKFAKVAKVDNLQAFPSGAQATISDSSIVDSFPAPDTDVSSYDPNAKVQLQKRIAPHHIRLAYSEYRPMHAEKQGQTFFIEVKLTGWGYTNETIGRGKGTSKLEAGNWAAMFAMQRKTETVKKCEEQFAQYREEAAKTKAARLTKTKAAKAATISKGDDAEKNGAPTAADDSKAGGAAPRKPSVSPPRRQRSPRPRVSGLGRPSKAAGGIHDEIRKSLSPPANPSGGSESPGLSIYDRLLTTGKST